MIILQAKEVQKAYGAETILENVNFVLQEGEKVGLVGPNGAGKTTLFRCLIGEESADGGEISRSDKVSLGYMEQIPDYPKGTTLFEAALDSCREILALRVELRQVEEAMAQTSELELEKLLSKYSVLTEEYERAGGYSLENKIRRVSKGLGFGDEDLKREVNHFSGGEKTRVSLMKLLLREPQLLLLDEPTNHLDMEAMEWLEDFLKAYSGAVLVISHDRYFLDQVGSRIIELDKGKTQSFNGNYSRYLILKEELVLTQTRAYNKQQAEIQKTEEYIERFRAGIKSKQARGRQSKLDRVERLDAPGINGKIKFNAEALKVGTSGDIVLEATQVAKAFENRNLFKDVDLRIYQGEKIALIGGNGTGKSTLLKIILNKVEADHGSVRLGSRVKVSYYDQEHHDLNPENRLIDELMFDFSLNEAEARNHLATMLFREDDVFKRIKDLSGGEKGRLSFLKILMTGANFLILDEPTNHLDIDSKQVIEEFMADYTGTVFFISHDRYFIDLIADKVLELDNTQIKEYLGNYTDCKEKKAYLLKLAEEKERELCKDSPKQKKQGQTSEDKAEKQRIKKLEKRLAETEEHISALEGELNVLGEILADTETYQDQEKAKGLVAQYKRLEEEIARTYEEWEKLEAQN